MLYPLDVAIAAGAARFAQRSPPCRNGVNGVAVGVTLHRHFRVAIEATRRADAKLGTKEAHGLRRLRRDGLPFLVEWGVLASSRLASRSREAAEQ